MKPTSSDIAPFQPNGKARSVLIIRRKRLIPRSLAAWRPDMPNAEDFAPGKKRRQRGRDVEIVWRAQQTEAGRQAAAEGYGPTTVHLEGSETEMNQRCRDLQAAMLAWRSQRVSCEIVPTKIFDGTLRSLIALYRHSEESPFHAVKYNGKRNYEFFLKRLLLDHGNRVVAQITRNDLFHIHKKYLNENGVSAASRTMMILGMVIKFGIGMRKGGDDCKRVADILKVMKFERAPPRTQYLTADMVVKFRAAAHTRGRPSMALAQAIQYETALRQKDVIGEWWPDFGIGDITHESPMYRRPQETWTSGLVWGKHISLENLVMAKPTSKSHFKKRAIADLSLCPMFIEEFRRIKRVDLLSGEPVIVSEKTGLPYREETYRTLWRSIADDAGIPHDHHNMDSRSGAVTEGSEAEIEIEHLRQFATHSDKQTTQHYNRDSLKKARSVHRKRAAHRDADEVRDYRGPIIDV